MRRSAIITALLLASGSAHADPIYLDCSARSSDETHVFSVTLDEDTKKITHRNQNGNAFNAEGFFSADEIAYKNVTSVSGILITHQYTINRVDLSVTYLFRAEAARASLGLAPKEIISRGSCSVVQPPERKI